MHNCWNIGTGAGEFSLAPAFQFATRKLEWWTGSIHFCLDVRLLTFRVPNFMPFIGYDRPTPKHPDITLVVKWRCLLSVSKRFWWDIDQGFNCKDLFCVWSTDDKQIFHLKHHVQRQVNQQRQDRWRSRPSYNLYRISDQFTCLPPFVHSLSYCRHDSYSKLPVAQRKLYKSRKTLFTYTLHTGLCFLMSRPGS